MPSSKACFFALLICTSLIPGCVRSSDLRSQTSQSSPSRDSEISVVVDIPRLVGMSPAQVEKVIGKATKVAKITDDAERMPGEYRDYKVEGALLNLTLEGLMIRYYRGVAVHFSLDLPTDTSTPEEALLMAGIDVRGIAPQTSAPLAERWSGRFNGIDFKDAAAMKLVGTKRYSTVQATKL